MKRVYAVVLGLVMGLTLTGFFAGSGLASADRYGSDVFAAPVSRDQAVKYVIARGLAQRGVPYSWGGGDVNGPSLGNGPGADIVGFDSSGLIQYVYAGVNAKLPRSSGAMYQVGQKVTPAQALPADLIFYGPEGTTTVAMFLGNDQMLEVTDAGVVVSPVRTTDMAPYLVRIIAGS
jgi:cell wall-associated NlpC family hydrolase